MKTDFSIFFSHKCFSGSTFNLFLDSQRSTQDCNLNNAKRPLVHNASYQVLLFCLLSSGCHRVQVYNTNVLLCRRSLFIQRCSRVFASHAVGPGLILCQANNYLHFFTCYMENKTFLKRLFIQHRHGGHLGQPTRFEQTFIPQNLCWLQVKFVANKPRGSQGNAAG